MWSSADKRILLLGWAQVCFDFSIIIFWFLWTPTLVVSLTFNVSQNYTFLNIMNILYAMLVNLSWIHSWFPHFVSHFYCSGFSVCVLLTCIYLRVILNWQTWLYCKKIDFQVSNLFSGWAMPYSGRWSWSAQWFGLHKIDSIHDTRHYNCSISTPWSLLSQAWECPLLRPPCGRPFPVFASLGPSGTQSLYYFYIFWLQMFDVDQSLYYMDSRGMQQFLQPLVPAVCSN